MNDRQDRLDLMERRATADLVRDTFARLPSTAQYAHVLPPEISAALSEAYASPAGRRVTEEGAALLRPYGLCEFGGRHLTVFSASVRNILRGTCWRERLHRPSP
jgi:hypothetical protein